MRELKFAQACVHAFDGLMTFFVCFVFFLLLRFRFEYA